MIDYFSIVMFFAILITIYSVMTMSLNLEAGTTGLPNFGQVGFVALGAFVSGTLAVRLGMFLIGASGDLFAPQVTSALTTLAETNPYFDVLAFLLGLVMAGLVGAASGFVASYPAVRLREDYLGITLLAIAEVIRLIQNDSPFFAGGAYGLPFIPSPMSWLRSLYGAQVYYSAFFLLVVLIASACYFYCNRLLNSPHGRVLRAIRDNEIVANSFGKDVVRAKIEVMMVGSALAAVGGALQVYFDQSLANLTYLPITTFIIYLMMLLGGKGNFKGSIAGAFVYEALDVGTSFLAPFMPGNIIAGSLIAHLKFLATGIVLLLLVVYKPTGLLREKPVRTIAWEVLEAEQRRS